MDGIGVGVFVGIGVVAGAQAIRAITKDRQAKPKKMDFFTYLLPLIQTDGKRLDGMDSV